MIEATASDMARAFHEFLDKAQHGETVLIRKHGKAVARLIEADKRAADAIEAQIRKLDQETEDALAH
jgi:prevent-host-death family protein